VAGELARLFLHCNQAGLADIAHGVKAGFCIAENSLFFIFRVIIHFDDGVAAGGYLERSEVRKMMPAPSI
jgi:hypothetical protein